MLANVLKDNNIRGLCTRTSVPLRVFEWKPGRGFLNPTKLGWNTDSAATRAYVKYITTHG